MSNLNQDQLHNRDERIFTLYNWFIQGEGFNEDEIRTSPGKEDFSEDQVKFIKLIIEEYDILEAEIVKYIPDTWGWHRFVPMEKAALVNAAAEILLANNKKAIVIDATLQFAKRYSGLSAKALLHAIIDKIGN